VMNALAAIAATLAIDIELSAIKVGLENITPALHRMQPYSLPNGALLIDDTYNANPFSLKAAVNTLAEFPGTKIVILADMKELGDDAKQIHFNCGQYIHAKGIDHLFTIGDLSAETARGFGIPAQHFMKMDREKLISALQPYLQKNVTILVKGSRSMQMEQVVYALTPHIQHEHSH
jgi:UDP-N-acetylmuramoyl-tripeptide--D-alanyl-D-alanine ligase